MAMTLADIRTKYPQYAGVDDQKLADALYQKYYTHADRREFDARIGLKPYQSEPEGFLKTVQNLPASIAESKYLVSQMGADAVRDFIDPRQQFGNTPPLEVTPGAPVEQLLDQPAGVTVDMPGAGGRLLPEGIRQAVGKGAAEQSVAAQLRQMEARKQIAANPVDMKPGLGADVAQGLASAVEMVPPAIASMVVRNPAPLVAYFTMRSGGQGYGEAMKAGAGTDTARAAAGLYAAAEAVTEAVAGKVFVEGGKTLIRSVLKSAAVEGLTEGVTEAIQALVDSQVIGEDMTLEQALDRIKSASVGGAVAGAPVAALTHVMRGGEQGTEATPGINVNDPVSPPTPAAIADAPIEERTALPAPGVMLALPPPEAFAPPPSARRQPAAPAEPEGIAPARDETDYAARIALQKSRQAETKELLQTARETITPLGTFTTEEIGGEAAQRVNALRIRTGRPLEVPFTVEELARAKVPQTQIDAVIAARKPRTNAEALTALDITRAAAAKNIIADDTNFGELAYRTVGARDPKRMTQAQLGALKDTLDAMPAHPAPVTVPIADAPSFTEDQYGKSLDALRRQGRYTAQAIKDATGLKSNKDVAAVRDAMVRRGQLVQRSPSDFRLYDTLGEERQTTPEDLPPGAFKEYVVRRIPVSKVRIRQDGKSLGTFGSATEARNKIRDLRLNEKDGRSAIAIEPAEDVAHGVMENRYDEAGNLIGQVVVDTHRDAAAAEKAAEQLNNPDVGARYTATPVAPSLAAEPAAPARKPPPPEALAGRTKEVLQRLNKLAKERNLPLIGTRVTIKPEVLAADGSNVEGMYLRNLISIAATRITPDMTTDEVVNQLAEVMDHEIVHALRKAGVLGPETDGWKTIVRYARRAKRPNSAETYMEWAKRNYVGVPGYNTEADLEEEAIAEAFRHWAANRRNVVGKPATVFSQIVEWFKRLFRSIPEDVFSAIETGQLVADALTPPGSAEPRARATRNMESAAAGVATAQAAKDENLVRVKSREYLRARAQAREDRYGRSGPKTVLGTTPSKAYATGEVGDRDFVAGVVDRYKTANGVTASRLMTLLPEPIEYLKKIADAQQRAAHTPKANDVAKAYRALVDETKAMFKAFGPLEISAWTGDGAPYASPAEMLADIAAGKLRMRLSDEMFGPGADNPGHPFNAVSGYRTTDGKDLTVNDIFRVVHDVYGHGQSGFRDDPRGAYNAYHEHALLLAPEARRALATETLAQRAWQDYGAHLRRADGTVPRESDVDYLDPKFREFAQQKAFAFDDESLAADPGFALAEAAAAAEDPKLMVAYHGTPHKVDKFSSDKIGTGEGAQAFGHGLYFAGKKEIADHYKKTLSSRAAQDPEFWLDVKLPKGLSVPEQDEMNSLGAQMRRDGNLPAEDMARWKALKAKKDERDAAIEAARPTGNLYKVDIPEDHELLDWDAKLADQPKALQSAVRSVIEPIVALEGIPYQEMLDAGQTFGDVYFGLQDSDITDREISRRLREAGIPGHRYFDGGSRSAGDGTRNYVIYDDSRVQILEENPKFSRFDDNLPGGRLYGNPNRSPGGALSKPGTPTPSFTNPRLGNQYFGGELAEHQLQMARAGERGAALIYLSPEEFLALSDPALNPEQEVYDAAISEGYKFSGFPSLVLDGYAGNVRAAQSDAAFSARALAGRADSIPVMLYPKRAEGIGLITALEAPDGSRVPFPREGMQEFIPDNRGPRYSVGSEQFRKWFGDSKVVDENGRPQIMYHGSDKEFTEFNPALRGTGTDDGWLGHGIYFTPHEDVALAYGKNAMPVYLSIKNPYRFPPDANPIRFVKEHGGAAEFTDWVKAQGHDGIISERVLKQTVAFEPTQIKSAIANNGQYDAANPDIRYSLNAPYGERAPKRPTPEEFDLYAPYTGTAHDPLDPLHSPERNPTNPLSPDTFNIVHQRVEGYMGRFLERIGRAKKALPLINASVFEVRTRYLDEKMLSVKEMMEAAKADHGLITDLNDAYVEEMLYHGKVYNQIDRREKTLYLDVMNAIKDAIETPIGNTGGHITLEDIDDYLIAMHTPERNAYLRAKGSKEPNPSGATDEWASGKLDQLALDGKLPMLEGIAAKVYAVIEDTNKTRLENGLISRDVYDSRHFQYYVPLRGIALDEMTVEDLATHQKYNRGRGRGFSVRGKNDVTARGRDRKATDVIGHTFLQNTETVIRAEKNNVAKAFIRFLLDNPALQERFGKVTYAKPPGLTANSGTVVAKVGGKDVTAFDVPSAIANTMNADYPSASNGAVKLMGKLNRYLAAIHTAFSPLFQIRGLVRDGTTVAIMGQQYDIPQFSRKVLGNVPAAMRGIAEVLFKGTATSQWAQAFEELQTLGGTSEFLGINDLEQQQKKLLATVVNAGGNPTLRQTQNIWDATLKAIENVGKVAENSYRLSAFVTARQAGVPPKLAAVVAKRISVNFTQGSENKTLMNSLYLFYNANMSGNAGMMRGLKNKRMQKIVFAGIAAGAAMDLIMRAVSGDDDDDGRPDYDQIDPWTKQTNWIIKNPFGPGYSAVPVPYGFNIFLAMGRNLNTMGYKIMSGEDPVKTIGAAVLDQTVTTLEAFNPLGGLISVLNFLSPTAASPIVSLETNKDFAGRAIVPDRGSFGAPIPESQKYYSTTSEVPKSIAAFINSATGGNEVRPGMLDVSPESIRYVTDFLTPDIVKLSAETGITIADIISGQWGGKSVGDAPLLNKFYIHDMSRSTSNLYYQIADEVQRVGNEYDLFIENGRDAELDKLFAEKGPELDLILPLGKNKPSLFSENAKEITGLRKLKEQLLTDGDRAGAKAIDKEITATMAAFNRSYLEAKGLVPDRFKTP